MHDAGPPTFRTVGAFGEHVAGRIAVAWHDSVGRWPAVASGASAQPSQRSSPVILASSCEAPGLSLEIDADPRVPWWLPVVYRHPLIRIGPVFAPGLRGCYRCLEARMLSLAEQPERLRAQWEVHDSHRSTGPAGFLLHHVMVATALAVAAIGAHRSGLRHLHTYDVLSGAVERHAFSALPNCPRPSAPAE